MHGKKWLFFIAILSMENIEIKKAKVVAIFFHEKIAKEGCFFNHEKISTKIVETSCYFSGFLSKNLWSEIVNLAQKKQPPKPLFFMEKLVVVLPFFLLFQTHFLLVGRNVLKEESINCTTVVGSSELANPSSCLGRRMLEAGKVARPYCDEVRFAVSTTGP